MTQRLHVLISAYACRPGEGSEPGIGWDLVQELAKHHQLWVLTRKNNQPSIETTLNQLPLEGLQFVYLDIPDWAQWWKRGQRGVQLHYYLWQIAAYFVANQLCQKVQFDLIHHVTYVKYWGPSFLSLLPVPFLWGPVGGGESAPEAFWQDFGWRGNLYETARNMARWIGEHDPFVRMTAQRSILARATTEETAQRLRAIGAKTVQVYSQVGLSQAQINELVSISGSDRPPVRFISIGRLLHWKGFHLGLRAFAKANLPEEAEYWIVGDGPERQRLETLVEHLGIRHQVNFWGMLPQRESLKRLVGCLALVHPSLHESGGLVCVEALAAGRPVICLDIGGPAVQVTEAVGFKLAAHTPEQTVQDMATVMTHLAKDTELWLKMSRACHQHVDALYSWEVKGRKFAHLYQEIVESQRLLVANHS